MSYNITNFHASQEHKTLKSYTSWFIMEIDMKKAIYILIVIVLLFIINGLLHSIYDLWHKQDLLTSTQKQLQQEELKNQQIKSQLSYVQSKQFIIEEAHDKLFLVQPGQQEVLISPGLITNSSPQVKARNIQNWQKWLNLFF